jgi:hypothetical protein
MKKIHVNGLKMAAKLVQEKAAKARGVYDSWNARLKELDGPQAKRNYTALRLEELRTDARTDALRQLRHVKADMRVTIEPALGQRKRWTKAALLREERFSKTPKEMGFLEEDRRFMATTEQLHATRELSALIRAGRLDDDALLEEIENAVEVEDLPYLGVLTSEAGNRKAGGELYKLKVNQAIKKLDFPELADAEKAFSEIETAAAEVVSLEYALENPFSSFAQQQASIHPTLRAIEERQAARAAEQKAKDEEGVKLIPSIDSPFVPAKPEQSSAA